MCIGKKECAKVNDKKEKLQKCLLLLNIRELNLEFKKVKSNSLESFNICVVLYLLVLYSVSKQRCLLFKK